MTTMIMPKFMDSEYFMPEYGNWHLLPDAPQETVKEFNEWMDSYNKVSEGVNKAGKDE